MPFDGLNTEPEVVQMLRIARGLIERGWTTGRFRYDDTYCLVGAYRTAFELHREKRCFLDNHPADPLLRPLVSAGLPFWTRLFNGRSAGALINYNDHKGRTQAEVLQVFDRAIAKASRSIRV